MIVSPSEIESIEEAGMMNGSSVKLLRTKGGFWIAIGNKSGKEEALAAGSHPAIVRYNLEKNFTNFRPMMMKSEASINNEVVSQHTKFLSDELQKSGHDIYSIQTGSHIEFQLTKHDVKIGTVKATLENDSVLVKEINIPKEFSHVLAGAVSEKAISLGASRIGIQGK